MSEETVNLYAITMIVYKSASGRFEAMPNLDPNLYGDLTLKTFGKDVVIKVLTECIFADSIEHVESKIIYRFMKDYPESEGWHWHFANISNVQSLLKVVVKQIMDEHKLMNRLENELVAERLKITDKEEFEM